MPTATGRLKKSTELPAGASYTLFRWTSKQEDKLEELLAAVTRLTGSGVMRGEKTS
jgi:hypothetical protein